MYRINPLPGERRVAGSRDDGKTGFDRNYLNIIRNDTFVPYGDDVDSVYAGKILESLGEYLKEDWKKTKEDFKRLRNGIKTFYKEKKDYLYRIAKDILKLFYGERVETAEDLVENIKGLVNGENGNGKKDFGEIILVRSGDPLIEDLEIYEKMIENAKDKITRKSILRKLKREVEKRHGRSSHKYKEFMEKYRFHPKKAA